MEIWLYSLVNTLRIMCFAPVVGMSYEQAVVGVDSASLIGAVEDWKKTKGRPAGFHRGGLQKWKLHDSAWTNAYLTAWMLTTSSLLMRLSFFVSRS